MNEIENEYQKIKSITLEQWRRNVGEGNEIGFPYDGNLFGMTLRDQSFYLVQN